LTSFDSTTVAAVVAIGLALVLQARKSASLARATARSLTETSSERDQLKTEVARLNRQVQSYELMDRQFFKLAKAKPDVTPVEIVVAFIDVRGFTRYVATHSQSTASVGELTMVLFGMLPRAVDDVVCSGSNAVRNVARELEAIDKEFSPRIAQDLLMPNTFKRLGDGVMLVWEMRMPKVKPEGQITYVVPTEKVTAAVISGIFDTVHRVCREFTSGVADGNRFDAGAADLRLGCGLGRGPALRLDLGRDFLPDYVGTVCNRAARLQGLARPHGWVVEKGLARPLEALAQKAGWPSVVRYRGKPKGLEELEIVTTSEVEKPDGFTTVTS
jgi:class 3 adenylate cyclase